MNKSKSVSGQVPTRHLEEKNRSLNITFWVKFERYKLQYDMSVLLDHVATPKECLFQRYQWGPPLQTLGLGAYPCQEKLAHKLTSLGTHSVVIKDLDLVLDRRSKVTWQNSNWGNTEPIKRIGHILCEPTRALP